jgi:hypothetical protein
MLFIIKVKGKYFIILYLTEMKELGNGGYHVTKNLKVYTTHLVIQNHVQLWARISEFRSQLALVKKQQTHLRGQFSLIADG